MKDFILQNYDHSDTIRSCHMNIDKWMASGEFPNGWDKTYVEDVIQVSPEKSLDSMMVTQAYLNWFLKDAGRWSK